MWYLSNLHGNYYKSIDGSNFTEVPKDDMNGEYLEMINSGNIQEVESFDFELMAIKIKKAIEIDLYYTKKISDLMMKHNDKLLEAFYTETTYIIHQSALDEKQALKNECNAKITELGITDFTYRQSVPKLAKTIV